MPIRCVASTGGRTEGCGRTGSALVRLGPAASSWSLRVAVYLTEWNLLGVDGAGNRMHGLLALVGVAIAWGAENLATLCLRRR